MNSAKKRRRDLDRGTPSHPRVPVAIPAWMFKDRPELVSRNRDDVTNFCQICGLVEPSVWSNGFARRKCQCEEIQQFAEQREQRIHLLQQVRKPAKTYTWLGHGLDDLYRKATDERGLESKSFANFDPTCQPDMPAFQQHLFTAKMLASRIISSQKAQRVLVDNLILAGAIGTGKTHLAAAILNALREQGIDCLFSTAQDLFNALYAAKFDEKLELLAEVSTTPLWVCDDLDKLHIRAETDGAYQKRTLFDILDKRYKRGLATVITTNETGDLSPWLDNATVSRLQERLIFAEMVGIDYRGRER